MDDENQRRRVHYFERLGEQTVRADLEGAAYRYIGESPESIQLAQRWLFDKSVERQDRAGALRRINWLEWGKWAFGFALLAVAIVFFDY